LARDGSLKGESVTNLKKKEKLETPDEP
jgi:hypothetical protein